MNTKFNSFLNEMASKRVAIIGMGVSNTPLIRLLLDAGADVLVCDRKKEQKPELIKEFKESGARFNLGDGYLEGICDSNIIFKTPGIRYDIPELSAARERGAVVTTEMEQFFKVCPCTSIGVTGSDGKTTTTTVIGELLKRSGKRCFVGGNIGVPLLSEAGNMQEDDVAVVELSSFQLMDIKSGPDISVITNITPNHLDVHKSMEEYIKAKKQIYAFSEDAVVLNYDNLITRGISDELCRRAVRFSSKVMLENGYCLENGKIVLRRGGISEPILNVSDIRIPGMHNVENYMAAIAATSGLVSCEDIIDTARQFPGVPHRMELIREKDGVRYYNDSIASSPTRTIAGLRAFDQKVILIAGGYDKNIPFGELGEAAPKYVKKLILVGATADKIESAVRSAADFDEDKLPIFSCDTFEGAIRCAESVAEKGDIVTLSPACASFDMFENFAARGERFRELVNRL